MKVLTWNLNNRKRDSLHQVRFVIDREPDILVLTEVHPSRLDLWKEALKGYDIAPHNIGERKTESRSAGFAGSKAVCSKAAGRACHQCASRGAHGLCGICGGMGCTRAPAPKVSP